MATFWGGVGGVVVVGVGRSCSNMLLFAKACVSSGDDVLPDGTVIKKGTMVTYHTYAMGRVKEVWGGDWMEFRPERWLEKDETTGKDMAFLQMKKVVAGVLLRFKVVPVAGDGGEPVLELGLTLRMKDGFPMRIEERK
ncbi:hypothetical protein L1987_86054 [Smallanthus sonchifolius]|uniref:Uncharacterized protein n=1 Tax=Smallanthus sonchifolius TaxID=185202 RepID=A0ACB8Y2F2_9ASTR|nr:hypothetical protein L1987_86054 [Smallanthus sonchifolius]